MTVTSPAPTVTIAANPTAITSGSSSTLTVAATNATTVTLAGSDGSSYTLAANGGSEYKKTDGDHHLHRNRNGSRRKNLRYRHSYRQPSDGPCCDFHSK